MLSWLFSAPLPVGSTAPDFELPDDSGKSVRLSSFLGHNVVLVFYPGDDTPVCRRQLCEFRDSWQDFLQRNILVFGINPQSAASHAKFRLKYQFPFPLLVDRRQRVASLYHAAGWFIRRTVYCIGSDGRIRYARRGKPSPDEISKATVQ